jgi:glycosyltransferase involved in cell wall biosynthesis
MPLPRRVAIVHEWLVTYAGSERVVRELLAIFPDADLFALVDFMNEEDRKKFNGKVAKTSFIQKLPFAAKKFRGYLPLMPLAVEQFDLSAYDLVISSSHAVAKGVLTGPDQVHICYCHTPIRYAWDLQHQYLEQSGLTRGLKSVFARLVLHYIRQWDSRTPNGVDAFVANSAYIARRIKKVYGRDAHVIYPPVDVEAFPMVREKQDFYVAASRFVPYKRMDLIVDAFNAMPDRKIIVLGDGPEWNRIRAKAGPNVTMLGYQGDLVLRDHLQQARAFVFAAEEDFGIMPVEALACGTPVIAFGRGGVAESVRARGNRQNLPPTGTFFDAQTVPALIDAIGRFEQESIKPQDCRDRAEAFSAQVFRSAFRELVEEVSEVQALPRKARMAG